MPAHPCRPSPCPLVMDLLAPPQLLARPPLLSALGSDGAPCLQCPLWFHSSSWGHLLVTISME
jgi:hypothetical protein